MPVLQQFAILRAREWGRQSEQQLDVLYLAASSSAQVEIVPASPFEGMIVHYITFHRTLPNAYKVNVSQSTGVNQHEVVVSADLLDVSFWAYITSANPLVIKVINRLAFNGFLGATLATINYEKREDMEAVRNLLTKEFGIPQAGLPIAPGFPIVSPGLDRSGGGSR